jgi:epoxyqueuosine reductase
MLNAELKKLLTAGGASLVGFANLKEIAPEAKENFPSAISIAVTLDAGVISGIHQGPTEAYYAEYRRINELLASLGQAAERSLKDMGHRARALPVSRGEDQATLTTKLPHKTAATRAGLGWIGRCALLVTREFGSAIRLTTVLTDAPISTGQPINSPSCGDCVACIEICPARAPNGREWEAGLPRESLYDAFACLETARERAIKMIGVHLPICGLCIVACPWTRKYLEKAGNTPL